MKRSFSLPLVFAPSAADDYGQVQFESAGGSATAVLRKRGMELRLAGERAITIEAAGSQNLRWEGHGKLPGKMNRFIGANKRAWRQNIPLFSSVEARLGASGATWVVYGSDQGIEYDLRVAPGADVSRLRLRLDGATEKTPLPGGDLLLSAGRAEVTMHRPRIFEEGAASTRGAPVAGGFVLEKDGSVGFAIGARDRTRTLVIDPSISVTYSTFLGGMGSTSVASVATDTSGNVYVGGTTTAFSTFPVAGTQQGSLGGPSQFFVAKLNPAMTGPASLEYLTFLGGSGAQSGGLIAVDLQGDVAITGATTSFDFPVTDGTGPSSALAAGVTNGNEVALTELDPTGANLVFSTVFGGTGTESLNGAGGIAIGPCASAANECIYIASDVEVSTLDPMSPDLLITAGAMQPAWDGATIAASNIEADAFLAIFQPPASSGGAATLTYCTYLGTNSDSTDSLPMIGGIAVDSTGAAYIVGATRNDANGFPAPTGVTAPTYTNVLHLSDGFLMKIQPAGNGASDLVYTTLLGGAAANVADAAYGVVIDSAAPYPNAYITGMTQSPSFAQTPVIAGFRTSLASNPPEGPLPGEQNAFLAVVSQSGLNSASLSYLTYLGGSSVDGARGIAVAGANAVYIGGSATSLDFPWHDNAQPFSSAPVTGSGGSVTNAPDAFVAKFDTTIAGTASLIYATPLSGTAPPGGTASSAASALAVFVDASGAPHVYAGGQTTSADFPLALATTASVAAPTGGSVNGFDPLCASCGRSPVLPSGFMAQIDESANPLPSLTFPGAGRLAFLSTPIGVTSAASLVGIANSSDADVTITSNNIAIVGQNAADFRFEATPSCTPPALAGMLACTLGITFTPSYAGPEQAFLSVADGAPGGPQLLELDGFGNGPAAAVTPAILAFGSVPLGVTLSGAITISNVGNAPLVITSPAPLPAGFVLEGTTCAQVAWTVPANQDCTLTINFEPQSLGVTQTTLTITDNSAGPQGETQTVQLSGTGALAAPVAVLAPGSVSYGSLPAGSTSPAQTVTLFNQGNAPLSLASVTISGPNASEFQIDGDACAAGALPPPTTENPSSNCALNAVFEPLTPGAKSATLTFVDNASGSPQMVPLTGTATSPAPSISISPSGSSINFGGQAEGTLPAAGAPVTLTITNTGSEAASALAASLKLTGDVRDFTLGGNTCLTSGPLSSGQSCSVQATFAPACTASPAIRTATLTITDNAVGSPQNIALSGTATGDFCIVAPAPASVAPGATANFALNVFSANNYSGQVTFTSSGEPTNSTYTFSPSAATSESASVPAQITLSVVTGAATTTSSGAFGPGNDKQMLALAIAVVIAMCALIGWLGARDADSGKRRRRVLLFGSALVVVIVAGSCGGGATTSTDPPAAATAAGTYTLTITGTAADGTTHTTNATLIVQ